MGQLSIWHWIVIAIPIGLCALLLALIRQKRSLRPGTAPQSPSGVGGWLALLVVGLVVLGPLFGASSISANLLSAEPQSPAFSKLWVTYKNATWLTFLATAALSIWGGWGLATGNSWRVVRRAKLVLWLTGPAWSILLGVVLPALIFGKAPGTAPEFLGAFTASVIAAAVWTAYLSRSKRVRATYSLGALPQAPGDTRFVQVQPTDSRKADVGFLCVALAGLAATYLVVATKSDAARAAFAVGRLTGSFVVIAAIGYLAASGRKLTTRYTIYIVATLAMLYFMVDIFKDEANVLAEREASRKAASRLAANVEQGIEKARVATSLPPTVNEPPITAPLRNPQEVANPSPSLAESNGGQLRGAALLTAIEPIIQSLQEASLKQQLVYQHQIGDLHIENVIAPSTLASATSYDRSLATISAFVRLSKAHKEDSERLLADYVRRVRALNMAPDERLAFENGYGASSAKTRALIREWYDIEQEVASTLVDLVSMMDDVAKGGRVQFDNGKLLFSDADELARYNGYVDALHGFDAKERSVQQKSLAGQQAAVNQMRTLGVR